MSKRRPRIDHWERGRFFGASVVRGYIDGRRVTALFRWWSNNRFGVSWGSAGSEEVWTAGEPSPRAFEEIAG